MKFIIEEDNYSFQVDWSKLDTLEQGFHNEYFPSASESLEAFIKLLYNIHSPEGIADALSEGLDAMDYSEKGKQARKILEMLSEEKD